MTNDKRWSSCPEGTIGQLKDSLDAADRQHKFSRRAAVGAILLGGIGLGVAAKSQFGGPSGGITCEVVHQHSNNYVRGTIEAGLAARIDAHRKGCSKCDAMLRSLDA